MHKQQEISSRNDYIRTLQEFVVSSKERLHDTLGKFNWTSEETFLKANEKPLVSCSLNSAHRVAADNVDKHLKMCRWHQEGYSNDSVPLPSPTTRSAASVVIDKDIQAKIILRAAKHDPTIKIGPCVQKRDVPQTSDRLFSDFTTDERRVLYDYVVARTAKALPQLKEFNLTSRPGDKSASMTREQLMAAERDAKRRRVRHRSAKVHTKSKNYSEVLREVINNQMLAYEDWVMENYGDKGLSQSDQLEKRTNEDTPKEKQEMIWLDSDFRGNPHLRWKYILEKEKRKAERREKNEDNDKEKDHRHRRKQSEGSSSRRNHGNEYEKEKYSELHRRNKHDRNHQDRYNKSKSYDSQREQSRYDHEIRDHHRNEPHRKERVEYDHLRSREDKYKEYDTKGDKYRREKTEYKYDNRYKESQKESERKFYHYKDEKTYENIKRSDKHDRSYEDQVTSVQIKKEPSSDFICEPSYERLRYKEEKESDESDFDSGPSHSSISSHTKEIKRKKKSKKKHKHKKKHKKHHKSEKYVSSPSC